MKASTLSSGSRIIDWLEFEAFYLYSNDNDDGSDALLSALADAGVITWI